MKTVFIAGSRSISRLNPTLRAKLSSVLRKKYRIVIGDANGADKAVQKHLQEMNYRNVVVFCMRECRNNLGGWPTRCISSDNVKGGFDYYSKKDERMARDSDCGLMLWDGKSRGTLRNIVQLLQADKTVLVYLGPEKKFYTLEGPTDLRTFLAGHVPAALRTLESESFVPSTSNTQPAFDF